MPEAPLELVGLSHAFGETTVLAPLDLTLAPGELLVLLGASGCGKTTVLRSVAGLVTPTGGAIKIAGREVARDGRDLVPVERRKVGLVFQEYALFPSMTVRANIAFGLTPADEARDARVDELLGLVGLADYGARRPGELSGGQQQRVALARALAPRPDVLLLDEPFANVDAGLRRRLGAELRGLLRAAGTTALLVTHDPGDALALADRLALLVPEPSGAVLAELGPPRDVYRRPQSEATARLLGPARFVRGEATGERAETPLGSVALIAPREGAVTLLVRPEQAVFHPGEGEARVTDRTYLGRGERLICDTPAGEVWIDHTDGEVAVPTDRAGRVELPGPLWALP